MGKREMVVALHLGKTVGWGRSLRWANWVHVTNVVSRWLDSGFEVPINGCFGGGTEDLIKEGEEEEEGKKKKENPLCLLLLDPQRGGEGGQGGLRRGSYSV